MLRHTRGLRVPQAMVVAIAVTTTRHVATMAESESSLLLVGGACSSPQRLVVNRLDVTMAVGNKRHRVCVGSGNFVFCRVLFLDHATPRLPYFCGLHLKRGDDAFIRDLSPLNPCRLHPSVFRLFLSARRPHGAAIFSCCECSCVPSSDDDYYDCTSGFDCVDPNPVCVDGDDVTTDISDDCDGSGVGTRLARRFYVCLSCVDDWHHAFLL